MRRGDIWWAALPDPSGSEPGYSRPVLVVQADSFTKSAIRTVVVAMVTGNTRLAAAPGNVLLPRKRSRLPHDSVVNVSQLYTLDKSFLTEKVAALPRQDMTQVDTGMRLALGL